MMGIMALSHFDIPDVIALNTSTRNGPIYDSRAVAGLDIVLTEARGLIEARPPSTVAAPLPIEHQTVSQLDRTIATLNQYANLPAGGGSAAARQALNFLSTFPKYLCAPKAAENDSGMVTLFWDTELFYADIEFRGDEKLSFFSRSRANGTKNDEFLEDCPIEDAIRGTWLAKYLGPLFPSLSVPKAA